VACSRVKLNFISNIASSSDEWSFSTTNTSNSLNYRSAQNRVKQFRGTQHLNWWVHVFNYLSGCSGEENNLLPLLRFKNLCWARDRIPTDAIYLFPPETSRPALVPLSDILPGVKRPGHEGGHSPHPTANVKMSGVMSLRPPFPQYAFMEWSVTAVYFMP